jgi:hypothetical protein
MPAAAWLLTAPAISLLEELANKTVPAKTQTAQIAAFGINPNLIFFEKNGIAITNAPNKSTPENKDFCTAPIAKIKKISPINILSVVQSSFISTDCSFRNCQPSVFLSSHHSPIRLPVCGIEERKHDSFHARID